MFHSQIVFPVRDFNGLKVIKGLEVLILFNRPSVAYAL